MTKVVIVTDPDKMVELMRQYPRLYGSGAARSHASVEGQCKAKVPREGGLTWWCRRPADHVGLIHVHAYSPQNSGGVQDPTTDNPRWKVTEVAYWFDDAVD